MKGLNSKLNNLRKTGEYRSGCYDKLVFKKVSALIGGNVRYMITGGAPIAGEVLEFLKVVFSAPICEGYGQTETAAASTLSKAKDPMCGTVGGPLACVKIRLRDVPEMGYLSTNNPP